MSQKQEKGFAESEETQGAGTLESRDASPSRLQESRSRPAVGRPGLRLLQVLAAVLPCFLLLAGALLFPSTGRDDFFITCWPAKTLAEQGRILNYNGQSIEQSSSLTQVFLQAGLAKLTSWDVPSLGRFLSLLGGLLCVVSVAFLGSAWEKKRNEAWLAACVCAGVTPFLYWTYGGLESTLAALLAFLWVDACGRWLECRNWKRRVSLLLLGLGLALVRPEMMLVQVLVLLGFWAWSWFRKEQESAGLLFLFHLAWMVPLLLVRQEWMGAWMPQPVLAKAKGFSWSALFKGFEYWEKTFQEGLLVGLLLGLLLLGFFLQCLRLFSRERVAPRWKVSLLFGLGYIAFVTFSGGDWMEGGRFLVPLAPFLALSFVSVLGDLYPGRKNVLVVGFLLLQALAAIEFAATSSTGMPLWASAPQAEELWDAAQGQWKLSGWARKNRSHLRDLPTLVFLEKAVEQLLPTKQPVRILSGQMGMISYYLAQRFGSQVYLIDRGGLTGRDLTDCSLLAEWPRSSVGLLLGYGSLLPALPELQRQCGFQRPDIIFDRNTNPRLVPLLRSAGFQLLYQQRGSLRSDSKLLPGVPVEGEQFIALSQDYMTAFGAGWPVLMEFDESP